MPSFVMIALVAAGTLNLNLYFKKHNFNITFKLTSSAANLSTAVNGVFSGTLRLNCNKNFQSRNKFLR